MGRRKCCYKLTNAVYANPGINRKLVSLGKNMQDIRCILNGLEKISACKKLRK